MQLVTNLGYFTGNDEWDTLTGKELAKYDVLTQIYTHKGECDWNPNYGTTIIDKLFQPKLEAIKDEIRDEIEEVFDNEPRFNLISLSTEELEDGWIFYCNVSYLQGTPEEWILNITKSAFENLSQGYYPLGEE